MSNQYNNLIDDKIDSKLKKIMEQRNIHTDINKSDESKNVDGLDSKAATFDPLSPEWFREKAKMFPDYDEKAKNLRDSFFIKYNVDNLKKLSGKQILTELFLNKENKSNLCYELEFNTDLRECFGSIKSGTSYKYGLFYSQKHSSWMSGSPVKPIPLSEEKAIELATKIKENLISGADIVLNTPLPNSLEEYLSLYTKLDNATDGYINKIWFVKYLQMLRPELLPPIYSNNAQKIVCNAINVTPNDNSFCRMAQIRFFAEKCGITNVMFNKVFWTYATGYIDDESVGDMDVTDEDKSEYTFDSEVYNTIENLVVYGTPGCGKSYYVKNKLLKDYREDNIIRTTFYQDYTNTDFVGQIMPFVSDKVVTYKFNPGPFALALQKAIENPSETVALVIEELNRGNAPSIFGDIFQLLDRENGKSEYHITNVNLQKYLEDENPEYLFNYIAIPSNMCIVATMNTSDQNVFTLDTAFKRRWDFYKLKNTFEISGENEHPYRNYFVPGMQGITWEKFVNEINEFIINTSTDLLSEDKQLGVFFVNENMLCQNENDMSNIKIQKFAYKVLEYLWDDVAKFERDSWFVDSIRSLDELVDNYVKSGKEVFKDGVFKE